MPELSFLVVTWKGAQVEEEKRFTLSTEFRFGEEETGTLLKEKHSVNIPLPPSEREDDWFVLLDFSPRQTPVPPGILISYFIQAFLLLFANSKNIYCDSAQLLRRGQIWLRQNVFSLLRIQQLKSGLTR